MPWNPEEICEVLHECGRLALNIQGSAKRSIKSDNTIVTEADTRIEDLIVKSLQGPEDRYFIGEETSKVQEQAYHRQALTGECFITDPVDGTVLYANDLPGWGVSLGYMNEGILCDGAVLFPKSGELIISSGDQVLYGQRCDGKFPSISDCRVLDSPKSRPESPVITISQSVVKRGRYEGKYSALSTGSCVSSMLYILLGGSIGYLTRTRLWDLAGTWPLLVKLGFTAFMEDGKEFSTEVSDEFWDIPPCSEKLHWRMKGHAVFCENREIFESVMGDYETPSY